MMFLVSRCCDSVLDIHIIINIKYSLCQSTHSTVANLGTLFLVYNLSQYYAIDMSVILFLNRVTVGFPGVHIHLVHMHTALTYSFVELCRPVMRTRLDVYVFILKSFCHDSYSFHKADS